MAREAEIMILSRQNSLSVRTEALGKANVAGLAMMSMFSWP